MNQWKWVCAKCSYIVEVPENKLPPLGDVHGKDGVVLIGNDILDITKLCIGTEFFKVK